MSEAITDADVRAAQDGDREAFRHIYLSLSPIVVGYLRARGVPDPEATTSDVFLTVFARLRQLQGGASGLRTFVISVAHARMVDEARRQSRHPLPSQYEPERDRRTVDSAETEALNATSAQALLQLLHQLPPDQREVLALRFVADLPLAEVAEVVQRSVGAVKQLQRRGLIALRELVDASGVTQW